MRPHLLVIDDSDFSRDVAKAILKQEGYRVSDARSAEEALAFLRQHLPDLILLDIMMPDVDGFETLERIRADPRLTAVPVIFLSALGDPATVERSRKLGVEHHLVKPVPTHHLLTTVAGTLRRYAELRRAEVIRPGSASHPSRPVELAATGVGPIDEQVGGLAPGRAYLVLGTVGTGKSVLTTQFLHGCLERGEGAVLVTTDRPETILYVGQTLGLDLRPHIASGRLVVLALAERFETALETRADVVAMTAEIAVYARECRATRIVVTSVLTLLCSTPRLPLSAPLSTELIGGFERTGATTLLMSDTPITQQEEVAVTYLKRTALGTLALDKDGDPSRLAVLRVERMNGVPVDTAGRPFRIAQGVGIVNADPRADSDATNPLLRLRERCEAEIASADQRDTGLARTNEGALRLRDPFALYLGDCLGTAMQLGARCGLLLARFEMSGESASAERRWERNRLAAADLNGLFGEQAILCWSQPGEVVVLAIRTDRDHLNELADLLRNRLTEIATVRRRTITELTMATAACPDDGTTADALLAAVGRSLAARRPVSDHHATA